MNPLQGNRSMIIAKTDILCELGHDRLLKPALIERALVANEQAKYYLTLLQNARAHAEGRLPTSPSCVGSVSPPASTMRLSTGLSRALTNCPKTPTALRPPLTCWRASWPPSRR